MGVVSCSQWSGACLSQPLQRISGLSSWATTRYNISLLKVVEQSSAGLELYSLHYFYWFCFALIENLMFQSWSGRKHVLNKVCRWHWRHVSLKNTQCFSVIHSIWLPNPSVSTHSFRTPHWTGSSGPVGFACRHCSCLQSTLYCISQHSYYKLTHMTFHVVPLFQPWWRRCEEHY